MRKRITGRRAEAPAPAGGDWLDLGGLSLVEVTSEDPAHAVESALTPGSGPGWRAGGPGEQVVRLLFDGLVRLAFREDETARTQEFVLRRSADGGGSFRVVIRQQYTFSPPGTTEEVEEYRVESDGATAVGLRVVPDIGGGTAAASIAEFRLG